LGTGTKIFHDFCEIRMKKFLPKKVLDRYKYLVYTSVMLLRLKKAAEIIGCSYETRYLEEEVRQVAERGTLCFINIRPPLTPKERLQKLASRRGAPSSLCHRFPFQQPSPRDGAPLHEETTTVKIKGEQT